MIPLRDVIPSRTTPFVTVTLIGINTLAFLYELSLGNLLERFIFTFGLVPADFSWVSVLTSMFLHGGLMHFGGNMLYLWIFGDNVEDRMGHGRFLVFYLLCGTVAGLTQTVFAPDSMIPMVGASGAIAGVMGAYFVLYPHSRIVTLLPFIVITVVEVPAILFLGIWFLMQFLSGVGSIADSSPGGTGRSLIAFWAHVAGFVAGLVGVFVFRRPERQKVDWWDSASRRSVNRRS